MTSDVFALLTQVTRYLTAVKKFKNLSTGKFSRERSLVSGEYHLDIPQLLLGYIQSRDASRPIARESL